MLTITPAANIDQKTQEPKSTWKNKNEITDRIRVKINVPTRT